MTRSGRSNRAVTISGASAGLRAAIDRRGQVLGDGFDELRKQLRGLRWTLAIVGLECVVLLVLPHLIEAVR